MAIEATWRSIRERSTSLADDEVLVTPADERVFAVDEAGTGWIEVRFRDGERRTLPREQFARLADQLDADGLALDELPPGVGPYVTLLTLAPGYTVADGRIRAASDAERQRAAEGRPASEHAVGPFVRSAWEVRRPPERVHDDALLLAELLERRDLTDPGGVATDDLVDAYVLLSDVQRGADDLRRDVGAELVDEIGPDGRARGRYGAVSRVQRERRRQKDDEVILAALDEAGVPREWVLGVDREKLDVVLATTTVDEEDVYETSTSYHVRKTGVASDAKRERLEGLRERLEEADGERADELREEVEDLEERIDEVLSTP